MYVCVSVQVYIRTCMYGWMSRYMNVCIEITNVFIFTRQGNPKRRVIFRSPVQESKLAEIPE